MRDWKKAFGKPDAEFTLRVQQTLLAIEEKEEQPVKKKMTLSFAFACILCVTVLAAVAFAASGILGDKPDETLQPLSPGVTETPAIDPAPETDAMNAVYWHREDGHFYHADETCSGMKNAVPVSAADAQAMGQEPCPICIGQTGGAKTAEAFPTLLIAADLAGCTPYALTVRAYDPNGRFDEIVNFNAVPEDENPGEINENTPNLAAAVEVFSRLTLTPFEGDEEPEDSLWHFGIDYTVMDDNNNPRTVRLDFYDYSNLVGYTRLYLPGDAGKTQYVTMPLEDSLALEDIYLNVVARLKRLPASPQD